MNKTVSAEFNSVDEASIATKNLSERLKGIDEIRISASNVYNRNTEREVFSDFFTPSNFSFSTQSTTNGIVPDNINGYAFINNISDNNQKKAIVSISVNEKETSKASSVLRTLGGYSVKVF